MHSNQDMTSNDSHLSICDLYQQYQKTYLSLSDLYTYEIIILFIYGIMIIFSFFTNFIAIIIFSFGRRSRSELTPFLLNLSLFNIIMAVYCIPFTITSVIFQRWLYARAFCVVLDVFKTFSVSGVLLTLIAIAIDRYCVVKYPLEIKIYSSKKRNLLALLIIWILSIALALLWSPARSLPKTQRRLWVSSRSLFEQSNLSTLNCATGIDYKILETSQCLPNKIARPIEVRRAILNSLQTYFFPLFILAFVYLRIAAMLWQRRNDVNSDLTQMTSKTLFTNEHIQFRKKLKKGVKMLIAVVVLYAILWLPMNVFQLCLNLFCYEDTKYQYFCTHPSLIKLLYITAHFLTVSNTAINPIIYGFANNRFRSDIRQLRRRLFYCQTHRTLYFRGNFVQSPSVHLEERPRNIKASVNFKDRTTQHNMKKSDKKRPLSLTDRNELRSEEYSDTSMANGGNLFTQTRHTT